MSLLAPRVILVRRETDLDRIRATYTSTAAASFVLTRKGLTLDAAQIAHQHFAEALRQIRAAIPPDWRQATILRSDVERFVFGPEDIILAVGQDGLVANVAKYLTGQTVIGINPDRDYNVGVLARFGVADAAQALQEAARGTLPLEQRVMAEAILDSGERLLALNEIFIGHASHQSARYTIAHAGTSEQQSSSGVVVTTGTGATGWASSIMRSTGIQLNMSPVEPRLGFLVREAWQSPATQANLVYGIVEDEPVVMTSQMDTGGTIFADGIESDHLAFAWGQRVSIAPARQHLALAVPG
jgi:hypothetical protein